MIAIEALAPEHFPTVARWLSDPQINRWLTPEWRGRMVDPVVIGMAVRNKRNRFFLVRSEGQPAGLVALADWDPVDKIAMVWYILGEPALAGRGLVTEALRQLTRTAFDELGIEALHAWIIDDNQRSRRVLEKNGFRETGCLRAAVSRGERRANRIYFDLIRADLG